MATTDTNSKDDWAYLEILDRVMRDEEAGRTLTMDGYLAAYPNHDDTVREVWRRVMTPDPVPEEIVGGRYRIVSELGRGGQATVYLADDTRLGRQVALKVLRGISSAGVSRQLMRLEREALAASRLDHPGICTVFDSGSDEGTCYIAMRLVEGDSLAKTIARRRHEADVTTNGGSVGAADAVQRTVTAIAKASSALATAHESRIIHRDIKPGNIMITPSGDPVILDFGLARDEESTLATLTLTGDAMGTPAYMAPEQWRGEGVGPAADVWALGVVLFEALTLTRPFEAPSRDSLAMRVRSVPHSDPRQLNAAVPADLKVIIDVALEKDPDKRYADAGALAADLWRYLRSEPILARPISPWTRARRWVSRNRQAAALVMSMTMLILGGLGASIYISVANARSADALRRERNEKQEALVQWTILDDLRRMPDLKRARDMLWPAVPERASAIAQWLKRARQVRDTLLTYDVELKRLRDSSVNYSGLDQDMDRSANVQLDPFTPDALRIFSDVLERLEAGAESRGALEDMRSRARRRLEKRRTWQFNSPLDESRHDALTRIVALQSDLDEWIAEMERRHDFALTVDERSLIAAAAAWETCASEVAANPIYKKLQLTPQRGLIPLGSDPVSGLQEFAHLQSGEPARRDGQGQLRMVAETGLVFVLVPPGSFSMGAIKVDREEEGDRNRSPYAQGFEMPVRAVDLGPFFLSKYEVTCAQWKRMAGRLPRVFAGAKALCPVGDVTWREAKSTLTRLSLDFPTEARWEYACRAGTGSSFYWGSDWRLVVEYENTSVGNDPNYALKGVNDNVPGIALIGHFKPNPWGFHDMGGNLTEWCADPWTRDYARSLDPDGFAVNERGERAFNDGYNCVLRGGHHARVPYAARSSYRSAHYGAYAAQMIGLRPVRELTR